MPPASLPQRLIRPPTKKSRTLFSDVLKIRFVKLVKLTHTLCLMNPDYFVPADVLQYLPTNEGMNLKRCGHGEYVSAMEAAKRTFPKCRAYEINTFLFLQFMSRSPLITAESRYFQVSTRAYKSDRWTDFDRNYVVYTDASRPGGPVGSWNETTNDGDSRSAPYPLTEPKRGDVILVRAGFEGRAIGIVHSNDYAEPDGLNERSRIHVYWINKAPTSLAQTDQKAFARTEPGSATMNTADRSIALLDTALRRRFVFEEMMPDPFHSDVSKDVEGIDCRKLLTAMNRRIAVLLDREHQIGHTYLLRVDTVAALASTFQTRIMPLLQEYFYDDWEKIRAVLNDNAFVRKAGPPEELIGSDLMDSSRAVYELLPAQDSRWTAPNTYQAIYQTAKPADYETETPAEEDGPRSA